MPEYLMLWFKRPEFDRYARYHSHGSVREIFDWEEMCNVELPIPPIGEQEKIVDAYQKIETRIALKKKINENLEAQASALFDELFMSEIENAEHILYFKPIKNIGKPSLKMGCKSTYSNTLEVIGNIFKSKIRICRNYQKS